MLSIEEWVKEEATVSRFTFINTCCREFSLTQGWVLRGWIPNVHLVPTLAHYVGLEGYGGLRHD